MTGRFRIVHATIISCLPYNRAKLAICEGKSTAFVIPAEAGIQEV